MIPDLASVVIPVYNRPGPLRESVASALAQSHERIEVLIVDDGSTDESGEVADDLAAKHPGRVRVLHVANAGPGSAREVGRRAARGEYLQYLDSDDLLLPSKIERQVAALRACPECSVAYGPCRETEPGGAERQPPIRPSDRRIERMFPVFLAQRWWNTTVPLYRAEACEAAGPWLDLRLEEDWEFDARVAALGRPVAFCEEPVAIVRDLGGPRLSRGAELDVGRLRDRATAHLSILESAHRAGVAAESPECARFARELFLLARQCGLAELSVEARRLYCAARAASTPERARGLDFRIYGMLARVGGWSLAARLSRGLDRLRGRFVRAG